MTNFSALPPKLRIIFLAFSFVLMVFAGSLLVFVTTTHTANAALDEDFKCGICVSEYGTYPYIDPDGLPGACLVCY